MIDSGEILEVTEEMIREKRDELIRRAAQVIHNNQETYVAQWIMHNQDKDFNDYMLVYESNENMGYNFFMVRKDDVNYPTANGAPRP